jgi:hypothetical protein
VATGGVEEAGPGGRREGGTKSREEMRARASAGASPGAPSQ